MKKRNIVSVLVLSLFITGNVLSQNVNWCGTDLLLEQKFKKDPSSKQKFDENFRLIHNNAQQYSKNKSLAGIVYIVPVVVHVIHDNGIGNISYAQIKDGIKVLNEDFRRMNVDTSSTRDVFQPFAVDSEFEFRLAEIDNGGNSTNGVVRINSPLTYHDMSEESTLKSLSYWNSAKYFNIWLVNDINSGTVGGYAQFPGWGSWSTYGVVMRQSSFGRIGTSTADGRTATHEVGHCFGLAHTFQGGCGSNCSSSGDYICDTPPVSNNTFGCSSTQNTCSNDANGPSPFTISVVDQIENYMSYDACQNMFTLDQKAAMKSSITSYTTLTSLVSNANLIATGTDNSDAVFSTVMTYVCAGASIDFKDCSYNAITDWDWTFPGGIPSASNLKNPTVTYNALGVYDATLTVTNTSGSYTTTKTSYITVMSPLTMPYVEGFESGLDWAVLNDDGGNTWEYTTSASYSGIGGSLMMNNYSGNTAGELDDAVSPSIDLSVMESAQLTFKYAYAQKNSTADNDVLKFYISKDCGNTWSLRWGSTGTTLAGTNGVQSALFAPTTTTQWQEVIIANISTLFLTENFRFKFEFTSDDGNNLYIDDINIDGVYKAVPILVLPPNFSADQPVNVALDWNAVIGATSHQYELDTSLLFSSPKLISGTKAYVSSSNNNTDTEHQLTNLDIGTTYYWRVRAIAAGPDTLDWSSVWRFITIGPVGIEDNTASKMDLLIFPNPVESSSVISFNLHKSRNVNLKIYDIMGREISTIVDER